MDKLTLEHLAPYLPYGLKAEMLDYECDYVGKKYDEIVGFHQWDKNCLYWSALTVGGSKPNIERIKPILRPLSDLTKEIEHNGERFVPKDVLIDRYDLKFDEDDDFFLDYYCIGETDSPWTGYHIIQLLIQWHFDVFGLIEKGLAIDINSIEGKETNS